MMDKTDYTGIDIAKAKFDMAFFEENDKKVRKIFDNKKKGFIVSVVNPLQIVAYAKY